MMARRFGGKHSPDGSVRKDHGPGPVVPTERPAGRNVFDGKRRSRAGGRVNLLFAVPLLFVFNAFRGDPADLILGLIAAGLLFLAAWLTRTGIFAQEAYEARRIARHPAFPRKIAGALLLGAGLVAGGLMAGQG
ncbi:MAG TPA: hypothetical protein VGA75_09555, partial [Paracoccaceae bacterium]